MLQTRPTRYALLFALSVISIIAFSNVTSVRAPVTGPPTYSLTPLPYITQEGLSINLILGVSNAQPSTTYQFTFQVRDPATKVWNSTVQSYTTFPGQTSFGIVIAYPSTSFIKNGRNDLVGQYVGWVSQVSPPSSSNPVAVTPNGFWFILTDKTEYQRTETVGIRASGYNASEPVTIIIRTQTTSTVVLNVTAPASSSGLVTGSWKIPRNAVLDTYIISATGKTTSKSPADAHGFIVRTASMTITSLSESKTSYQRTETMLFWFTAKYPDGQFANTGTALVNLTSTIGNSVSLTATYDSVSQTFNATYKTFPNNVTGVWTASLPVNSYDDGFGNTGPTSLVSTSPQLVPATLIITIMSKSNFAVNEQIRFNATIQYPDLTSLSSGNQVAAFVLFSGGGHNDTMFVFFDSTIGFWVGSYSPNNEPGGLWSITVTAADSATPTNSGKATKTIQLQDQLPVASFTPTSGTFYSTQAIHFNGTASNDPDGTIVSYAWYFGDGSTGSGATPSHAYSVPGTYLVKLNVTDNSGSTAVSTATLIVIASPITISVTFSSGTIYPTQLVNFNGTATEPYGTIISYAWYFGDGSTGSGQTPSHVYSIPGSYAVKLNVTDSAGNTKASTASLIVTARPIVVSLSQSTMNPTAGQAVTITISASDPDGTISTTTVDWGDGTTDTIAGAASTDGHIYSLTGGTAKSFTVTVTIHDSNGAVKSATSNPISVQPAQSNSNVSFPLYYFGILATLIAALLIGAFLFIRRHKVTHAKLKIDLEAVKAEAGRIENQDFFQSVKDQLKKDKEE